MAKDLADLKDGTVAQRGAAGPGDERSPLESAGRTYTPLSADGVSRQIKERCRAPSPHRHACSPRRGSPSRSTCNGVLQRAQDAGVSPIHDDRHDRALQRRLRGPGRAARAAPVQRWHPGPTTSPMPSWEGTGTYVVRSWSRQPQGGCPAAKRAWTVTGITRRFRPRKTILPATIDLGRQRNLAVVIHCRQAEADTLRMLRAEFDRHGRSARSCTPSPAIWRPRKLAWRWVVISFAGMVTYKNAQVLRAVAPACRSTGCWSRRTARIWRRCRCGASAMNPPTSSTRCLSGGRARRFRLKPSRTTPRTTRGALFGPALIGGLPMLTRILVLLALGCLTVAAGAGD